MSDSVRSHFDDEAGSYSDRSANGAWALLRRWETSAIASLLRPAPGERILDAGSGAGFYTAWLKAQGVDVTAMDLSGEMLRALRQRLDVPTLEGDLESTPIPARFDKVLCAGALEFCPHPARAIANLARALDPRGPGQLVLMAPSTSLPARGYRHFHKRHGIAVHLFTPGELSSMARAAGLRVRASTWAGFNHVARLGR